MFTKVLIANRGEIACRIIRTLDRLGVASVAVYSDADTHTAAVQMASEAVRVGASPVGESYLRAEAILEAAQRTGAQAIHPGYGFLSENADFAEACERAGIVFIGPTPQNMRDFGLKHTARTLAMAAQVPVSPGSGLVETEEAALREADRIGYPVMIKSTAGGGGIGMQLAASATELVEKLAGVRRVAEGNFKASGVFLEKFIASARHVEVQIFGDGRGGVAVLGDRDCSAQRRNQKVLEEAPAPDLAEAVRWQLHAAARRLGEVAAYRSAGTCEFLLDVVSGEFYFLEVNTRLQVEHCVTEEVCGIDLVEWMIRLAAGEDLALAGLSMSPTGHAIEARIYAEDPEKNFQPSCGLLTEVSLPGNVRVDGWVERGSEVTPFYDPMLAKVIARGGNREEAVAALEAALREARMDGIETNLDYLRAILAGATFRRGEVTTGFLADFGFRSRSIDVIEPGTHTTVQDHPGRTGYWEVGVPPSGPMDHFSFRLANRLVGNEEGEAGLECTVTGPRMRFRRSALVAVTGADMRPEVDGIAVPMNRPLEVKDGQILKLGGIEGGGCRSYVAVFGGLDVPDYLGSRSTFTLGKFGGHGGRILRAGDVLKLGTDDPRKPAALEPFPAPALPSHWEIGVFYGPHGAPDFFTEADIDQFFATDWRVHYNSSRTGIRLIGPKPEWARKDGGEAGLHPSNIHDNAYAVGAVDFTGDMPVILGVDGPSLGGFVCPAVIVQAELWKMGQLRPGDTIRFLRWSPQQAAEWEKWQDEVLSSLVPSVPPRQLPCTEGATPILHESPARGDKPEVVIRQAGDRCLLVEFGPPILDLTLRFCAHALMERLAGEGLPGILDLTPGIRSLQIHYDSRVVDRGALVALVMEADNALPAPDEIKVPSRVVHLPLSWDDPATRLAIEKYTQSVRKDAPWCPSNIEFIRRINGLESVEQVQEIVFAASYLVMGLGDVYLGAPVATPLDPRHRLVTTKYNPARTWTPENAVGIGGAYLCVYGMEGPGGYQFVGRTLQMWNRWRTTKDFSKPWLLRHFDQIRFYPVSADELLRIREDFETGVFRLQATETSFRLGEYRRFLESIAGETRAFKQGQLAAFEAERERWKLEGTADPVDIPDEDAPEPGIVLPPNGHAVDSHVVANVWKVTVAEGQAVTEGEVLLILEAMKMEIPVVSPVNGRVHALRIRPGQMVAPGQTLAVVES